MTAEIAVHSLVIHNKPVGSNYSSVWASDFIRWLVGLVHDYQNQSILKELNAFLNHDKSAIGVVFERHAHKAIYKNLQSGNCEYFLYALQPQNDGIDL